MVKFSNGSFWLQTNLELTRWQISRLANWKWKYSFRFALIYANSIESIISLTVLLVLFSYKAQLQRNSLLFYTHPNNTANKSPFVNLIALRSAQNGILTSIVRYSHYSWVLCASSCLHRIFSLSAYTCTLKFYLDFAVKVFMI